MKKKNGFTLIELLAVIVILAIIALIATPIILGIVEDARKDSFLRSVELVVSTTDIDIVGKSYEEEYIYEIVDGDISNLEVGVKNTEGMNGTIIYNNEGKEVYAVHNGIYCVVKNEKMEQAEIKNYIEGECNSTTTYPNGQRVYFDVYKGEGCTMEDYAKSHDGTDFQNSLTEYNGLNGTGKQNNCLLFYAFNDDGGTTVDLILDHNTTGVTYWTESGIYSNTDGPITVLSELKTATSSWKGTITPENYTVYQEAEDGTVYGDYTIPYKTEEYKARLITAQEIAQITGSDKKEGLLFNESTSNYTSWFFFDGSKNVLSDTCKDGNITGCRYGWLYDRTYTNCTTLGCYNNADEGMTGSGYWTSTSVLGNPVFVWYVSYYYGQFFRIAASNGTSHGARPVITVLKSKISPGVAPVIPEAEVVPK